jgi:hypothetical protein
VWIFAVVYKLMLRLDKKKRGNVFLGGVRGNYQREGSGKTALTETPPPKKKILAARDFFRFTTGSFGENLYGLFSSSKSTFSSMCSTEGKSPWRKDDGEEGHEEAEETLEELRSGGNCRIESMSCIIPKIVVWVRGRQSAEGISP